MTNKKLLEKLKEDMEMRGFSHYTKDSYYRKAKEIIEYFGKPMKQVTTKELREFLIYDFFSENMNSKSKIVELELNKEKQKLIRLVAVKSDKKIYKSSEENVKIVVYYLT